MKTFKQLKEELGGPTNVTGSAIAAGPNDIGVKIDQKKKKSSFKPILPVKPLTRNM